jgi:plasmid stabilization system protein ParE
MTKLGVRPEVEIDAFEAALWYESERPGLGIEVLDAVREAFRQIEGMPLRFPMVSGDVRRAILHRFPFGVFFFVEGDRATVIAILHLHRDPSSRGRRR